MFDLRSSIDDHGDVPGLVVAHSFPGGDDQLQGTGKTHLAVFFLGRFVHHVIGLGK